MSPIRHPPTPRQSLRRRRGLQVLAVGGAAVAVWAWALAPPVLVPPPVAEPTAGPGRSEEIGEPEIEPLPIAGFVRAIVPAEREPAAPLASPSSTDVAPPESPRLRLVGIIDDRGARRAALYDPQGDRLVVVAEGDRIGASTVRRIEEDSVELEIDGRSSTVRLSPAPGWERPR
jgi:hypothetical protein